MNLFSCLHPEEDLFLFKLVCQVSCALGVLNITNKDENICKGSNPSTDKICQQ